MKKEWIVGISILLLVISLSWLFYYFSQNELDLAPYHTSVPNQEVTVQSENQTEQDNQIQPESQKTKSSLLAGLINQVLVKNETNEISYPIVDTGVSNFYNNTSQINQPEVGDDFYGQDAHYTLNSPQYVDNNDGTVTDTVTGLIWQKEMGEKLTFSEAQQKIQSFTLAGKSDWRIPTIKELYSLIQFTGSVSGEKANKLFIDTNFFSQPLGNTSIGEREIDAQTWSQTKYVGTTMNGIETLFGVNFIDGRIKGYPISDPLTKTEKKMYFRFVRGNPEYGVNRFVDNQDGTITDNATGLQWQKNDSREGMTWQNALKYAEDSELAGYTDWRLPNTKELQSIVDYSRSLQTTNTAAIDPLFSTSSITDETGKRNYPFFWTSTTHLDGANPGSHAVYISFGEALGKMNGKILDVHGAGAQRSDPKFGLQSEYPTFFGPQGDVRRVFNYVRLVRTAAIQ